MQGLALCRERRYVPQSRPSHSTEVQEPSIAPEQRFPQPTAHRENPTSARALPRANRALALAGRFVPISTNRPRCELGAFLPVGSAAVDNNDAPVSLQGVG